MIQLHKSNTKPNLSDSDTSSSAPRQLADLLACQGKHCNIYSHTISEAKTTAYNLITDPTSASSPHFVALTASSLISSHTLELSQVPFRLR